MNLRKSIPLLLLLLLLTIFAVACTGTEADSGETPAPAATADTEVIENGEIDEEDFRLIDANANGVLEEREFNLLLVQADIETAGQFSRYDADEDRHITHAEFNEFLGDANQAAVEEIEDSLGAVDTGEGGS